MENKVEAVLFASGRAMEEDYLAQVTGLKIKDVQKALKNLQETYNNRDSALFIWNEGTKWKINVREEHADLIKGIAAETEMPVPVMATLALIAYRTPVLQADVIKSRGAGAYDHINELVEKEFIVKEKEGRSFKLKLAEKFYKYFDVEGTDVEHAFKDVKSSVKPKKIFGLDVVEAETDEEAELDRRRRESQVEIYNIKEQRENDKGFLEEFEGRLGEVSTRIGETEKDILEQKDKYKVFDGTEESNSEEKTKDDDTLERKKNPDEEEMENLAERVEEEIDAITKEHSEK